MMDLTKYPLPQVMDSAKEPPPQEIPLSQTSLLCPNYAAIGAVNLPAPAVVGRVVLVLPGLQLLPARVWASWRKTAVSSSRFKLAPAQGRKSGPERR